MRKTHKTGLTAKELQDCESFRLLRVSCQMNQQQWAQATGLSYGLVKRIEAHTIRCSGKTKAKVQNFIDQYPSLQEVPDFLDLETHILRDVFLDHMKHIPKKDAMVLSARCARKLKEILGYASGLDSPGMQAIYFQYLEQLLTVLSSAAGDAVPAISKEENVLDAKSGLRTVFKTEQIKKCEQTGKMHVAKDGEVTYQYSLFDIDFS